MNIFIVCVSMPAAHHRIQKKKLELELLELEL